MKPRPSNVVSVTSVVAAGVLGAAVAALVASSRDGARAPTEGALSAAPAGSTARPEDAMWAGLPREVPPPEQPLAERTRAAHELARPCSPCHAGIVERWGGSQHAQAATRFEPGFDPRPRGLERAPVAWVGVAPLRQLLVEASAGRWQVHDPAVDVQRREWFSIFGSARPEPGEWAHPTGRGMNFDAQCASCHVTDFSRHYDAPSDRYASQWRALGIACSTCHGEVDAHAEGRGEVGFGPRATADRWLGVCASCHSRRESLTGRFAPGEDFDDHARLFVADEPGLYAPNGIALDEVFEAGSLALSPMGHGGVTCLDCHEPHGGALRAGPSGDGAARASVCASCHQAPSRRGAPVVDARSHDRHESSAGVDCIDCHMPLVPTMQRDLRRDHSFSRPDPRLSQSLGTADACRGCHTDRSIEWATDRAEAWYGADMNARVRERARRWAGLEAGSVEVAVELAEQLTQEPSAAWRASGAARLAPFAKDDSVAAALRSALGDASPLVRAQAARALAATGKDRERIAALRDDPVRLVRLYAAWATRTSPPLEGALREEVVAWLAQGADHPAGAIRLSELALVDGRLDDARLWAERAVLWDPSAPSFHTLARAHARAGRRQEAERALAEAERALLRAERRP